MKSEGKQKYLTIHVKRVHTRLLEKQKRKNFKMLTSYTFVLKLKRFTNLKLKSEKHLNNY